MKKIWFYFVLWLINHIFAGTHFLSTKRYLLKSIGIKIGENTSIVGPIRFGTTCKISIGSNCWIGKNLFIDGDGEVIIGNNVDLAPHCVISVGGHEFGDSRRRAGKGLHFKVIIDDGCWICTRVTIVNNTHIHSGSVIAAGAIVISDIPENVMAAGCPAVIKRKISQ